MRDTRFRPHNDSREQIADFLSIQLDHLKLHASCTGNHVKRHKCGASLVLLRVLENEMFCARTIL